MADATTGKQTVSLRAAVVAALAALAIGGGLVFAADWANDYWHQEEREPPPPPKIPIENISIIDQTHIAQHEAGHVVERYLRLPLCGVDEVYIFVTKDKNDDAWGRTMRGDRTKGAYTDEQYRHADALSNLAGEAAEQIIRNKKPPATSTDQDNAGENIILLCKTGVCGECPKGYLIGSVCLHEGYVPQETPKLYAQAKADMEANKETVAALTNLLMEQPEIDGKRTLTRAQIEEFFQTHPLVDPTEKKE